MDLEEDDEKTASAIEKRIQAATGLPTVLSTLISRFAVEARAEIHHPYGVINAIEKNGELLYDGPFVLDGVDGFCKKGHVDGVVVKKVSRYETRVYEMKDGLLDGRMEMYRQGQLQTVEHYKGGIRHGKCERFIDRINVEICTEWYDLGRPCGVWVKVRPNYRTEIHWRDDWIGIQLTLFRNTFIHSIDTVVLGPDGTTMKSSTGIFAYFVRGKRTKFIRLVDGKPHGNIIKYSIHNRHIYDNPRHSEWEHGKLIEVKHHRKKKVRVTEQMVEHVTEEDDEKIETI